MFKYIFPLICAWLLVGNHGFSQISVVGIPSSFKNAEVGNEFQDIIISTPDKEKIINEDRYNDDNRFAVLIPVNINTQNSGTWNINKDGSRTWRLKITLEESKAMNLYFTDFNLPNGVELYLYDEFGDQLKGAYSNRNNRNNGLFASEMVFGENVIVELNVANDISTLSFFTISEISYSYRFINELNGANKSGECEVNINCYPEGEDYQDEKKGIVRIKVKISGALFWCSGSLVNNLREDKTPYILTADHCAFKFNKYASPDDLAQWLFDFNYEGLECTSESSSGDEMSFVGAEKIAHSGTHGNSCSDFYLVKLIDSIPDNSQVFFNGWSAKGQGSDFGVTIHHPSGDIKKISHYKQPLITTQWQGNGISSHWEVVWAETQNGWGVTEGGSSGSPIFDENQRIIGSLTGGYASCANTSGPDYYGKFSYHWDKNGVDDTLQLWPWLDPDTTGILSMGGVIGDTSTKIQVPEPYFTIGNKVEESNILIFYFFNSDSDDAILLISDILGRQMYHADINIIARRYELDISTLPEGVYIINVIYDETAGDKKFVKY